MKTELAIGAERVRQAFLNAEVLDLGEGPQRPSSKPKRRLELSQKSRESQVATRVAKLNRVQRDEYEERAAIIEFDGQYSREIAEYLAMKMMGKVSGE
ncbi:hypothetical protein ROA7450_04196 [Roseovarius albus]|uniref:Uncharacterized protein n=1 Tax=Roseovarius albus TaxID=1247867 RepID=A0A1X7AAK1_9RHOB|nr:hypothetical protein [Roseovarius albus]SLN74065.1 hypothetical protein ROA7450_04196 [Roseovarius albus]